MLITISQSQKDVYKLLILASQHNNTIHRLFITIIIDKEKQFFLTFKKLDKPMFNILFEKGLRQFNNQKLLTANFLLIDPLINRLIVAAAHAAI